MRTDDSLEKFLMLGKMEGRRRRGSQGMRWLDSISDAMNTNLGKLQDLERCMHSAVSGLSWYIIIIYKMWDKSERA